MPLCQLPACGSGGLCAVRLLSCLPADHQHQRLRCNKPSHYFVRMAVLLTRLMIQTTKIDHNLIGRCFQRHTVKPDPTQLPLTASTPKLFYVYVFCSQYIPQAHSNPQGGLLLLKPLAHVTCPLAFSKPTKPRGQHCSGSSALA